MDNAILKQNRQNVFQVKTWLGLFIDIFICHLEQHLTINEQVLGCLRINIWLRNIQRYQLPSNPVTVALQVAPLLSEYQESSSQ